MKWSKTCSVLLLLISLACADLIPIPTKQSEFPIGVSGNGTIWYQFSDKLNGIPIVFGNVLNPINVSITYDVGSINYAAQVCLNSQEFEFPISGVNLESSCPAGGLGPASNASTLVLPHSKSSLKSASSSSSSGAYTTQTISAQLYVKPTNKGGLLVSIPDSVDLQYFQLFWSGQQCSDNTYPVGSDNSCVSIDSLPTTDSVTLDSLAMKYYLYEVVADNLNALEFNATGVKNGLKVFIQRDYYPTLDWFLNAIEEIDDDAYSATILSPVKGEKYFFMLYNSDKKDSETYSYTVTEKYCDGTQFGFNCGHDSQAENGNPLNSYLRISADISETSPSGASVNNATGWSFDYFDDDDSYPNEYAYFSLADYPEDIPTPYYIRVSVGNNDAGALNGAPGFFAKKGGYPSAQSNHYNMTTVGDVAHQILIRVTQADLDSQKNQASGVLPFEDTWFFAVQLPSDFSIWVGVNCATNCSDGDHGVCYCNDDICNDLYAESNSYDFYYQRPSSLSDSAGACTCSDDQYTRSFDCSSKGSTNSVLYLFLIAVGGMIIVIVAMGVPLYCFLSHRKANYERV